MGVSPCSDTLQWSRLEKISLLSFTGGEAQNVSELLMLADGNGEFTAALGLELDGSGFGMGTRSQRFAMVVVDGTVTALNVEEGAGVDVSSAETIMALL